MYNFINDKVLCGFTQSAERPAGGEAGAFQTEVTVQEKVQLLLLPILGVGSQSTPEITGNTGRFHRPQPVFAGATSSATRTATLVWRASY